MQMSSLLTLCLALGLAHPAGQGLQLPTGGPHFVQPRQHLRLCCHQALLQQHPMHCLMLLVTCWEAPSSAAAANA